MMNLQLSVLPPDIFPVELQPIIYFTVLPTIILLQLVGVAIIYFIVMPPEARLYLWNKVKKYPMIDYETDSGVRKIECMKPHSEGVNYGLTTGNTYLTPRPISNELILKVITPELEERVMELRSEGKSKEEIDKDIDKKVYAAIKDVRDMERVVLRPSIVQGLGVPIFRCYLSKAIATTLAHLTGLEYSGKSKSTQIAIPLIKKTGKRIEAVELNLGKDKKTDKWVVDVVLPVDPNVVKKWFPYMWTQSQLKASNRISEELGRSKEAGMWKKYIMIIGAMVVIMAIFFVAVIVGTGGI